MSLGVLPSLLAAAFPAGLLAAAIADAASFTIPNRITAALALAFLPAALALHLPWPVIGVCAATGAAALLLGVGMFAMGWCGGGDAKLLAACALWLGWPAIPSLLLATSIAGGVLALGLMLARKAAPEAVLAGAPAWLGRLLGVQRDLPYGVAIAAGALFALPMSPLFAAIGRS